MNKYYVTFLFKGDYHFVNFTANQLANAVLPCGDDMSDFLFHTDGQIFTAYIWHKGIEYEVVFSLNGAKMVSVYEKEEEDGGGGYLVEGDIPWLLLKVEDKNGDTVYRLTDFI